MTITKKKKNIIFRRAWEDSLTTCDAAEDYRAKMLRRSDKKYEDMFARIW